MKKYQVFTLIYNCMLNYKSELRLLFWRMHGKIALRVTINGVPTNLTISKDLQQRIAANTGIVWSGDKDLYHGIGCMSVNFELLQMKTAVQRMYDLLIGYSREVTSKTFSVVYKAMSKNEYSFDFDGLRKCFEDLESVNKRKTIIECLNWLKNHKETVDQLEMGTLETYETRIKNVSDFMKQKSKTNLLAEQFNPALATQFCDWMREQGFSRNHIARHVITIKEALRQCSIREMIPFNPLIEFVFSREEREDLRHLEFDKLVELENLDLLSLHKRLGHSRDMFVFSCYTGLHYCDGQTLTKEHLIERKGNLWLFKVRQKTKRFGAKAMIKLHPRAIDIINKYGGVEQLPKLDNTETNYDLKILQKMINLNVKLRDQAKFLGGIK